ncbi:MAG: tetratricopeptide repeat protein [Hyphomicrobium sp.]|nr:tetratricopeptide repeat protein [Hyphomicrobium sp.]
MRTSDGILGMIAGAALLALTAGSALAGTVAFSSPREALKQGMSAYQGGYYEIAIPALEYAAKSGDVAAQYYLARIYADNSGSQTDHAKAYVLFRNIVDEHADADPEDDPRALYVGKSLTALASYVRRGLPEIGLAAELNQAILYLRNASTTFDDEDAQFELAKLVLRGEGFEADEALGRHWLSTLSERGHAGAQAFLADLLWQGKYMPADKPRALALIAIAVENAPLYERLWIEDIYQNIYCGAGEGIRRQATGIVAGWGNRYGRKPQARVSPVIGMTEDGPERTCQDGEPVSPLRDQKGKAPSDQPLQPRGSLEASTPAAPRDGGGIGAGFTYGSTTGPTLRDVGSGFAPGGPGER